MRIRFRRLGLEDSTAREGIEEGMKTRQEVTANKLRGGFYTPPDLVDFCLDRISSHLSPATRVLEPSIGDGAFIRGLARRGGTPATVLGLEPFEFEAERARQSLVQASLSGDVIVESAVRWAAQSNELFDAAFG